MTTPAKPDIERLAVSDELFTLAERFIIEAAMWRDPEAKDNLARAARIINQHARQALNTSDLEISRAYADAATRIIGNVEGARRFVYSINTLPSVKRPGRD